MVGFFCFTCQIFALFHFHDDRLKFFCSTTFSKLNILSLSFVKLLHISEGSRKKRMFSFRHDGKGKPCIWSNLGPIAAAQILNFDFQLITRYSHQAQIHQWWLIMSRVSPQMVQLTLYSCTESKTSGESDFSRGQSREQRFKTKVFEEVLTDLKSSVYHLVSNCLYTK